MEVEFEVYIGKIKNIQDKILEFINNKCKIEENYQNLIRLFNDQINPPQKRGNQNHSLFNLKNIR